MEVGKPIYVILAVVILATAAVSPLEPESDSQHVENLVQCVRHLTNQIFQQNYIIVRYVSTLGYLTHKLLPTITGSSVILTQSNYNLTGNFTGPKYYLIIAETAAQLSTEIGKLKRHISWRPQARMVFICSDSVEEHLVHLVGYLWHFLVTRFVIIVHNDKEFAPIRLYTGNAFSQSSSCGTNPQVELLSSQCMDIDMAQVERQYFLPNYRTCNFKITAYALLPYLNATSKPLVGCAIAATRLLFSWKQWNVSFTVREDYYKEISQYGVSNSLLQEMVGLESVGYVNQVSMDATRFAIYDISAYLFNDAQVWVVPAARPRPFWTNIRFVFQPTLWFTLAGMWLIITALWFLFNLLLQGKDPHIYERSSFFLLDPIAFHLGVSRSSPPKNTFLRAIFIILVIYGMHWVAAFQAKFVSSLTSPSYERQISNEEELFASNVKVRGTSSFHRSFPHANMKNVYILDGVSYTYERFHDWAAMLARGVGKKFAADHKDPLTGRSTLYIFKKHIYSFYISSYLQRGHPINGEMNSGILRLQAAGFVARLFTQMIGNLPEPRYFQQVPLTLNHLLIGFWILLLGNTISFAVFISELIYHRLFSVGWFRNYLHPGEIKF